MGTGGLQVTTSSKDPNGGLQLTTHKAKNADASLAEEAQKYIDTYYQYSLKEDAFMFGLKEGESYTVNCSGLSAVTRIRTRLK